MGRVGVEAHLAGVEAGAGVAVTLAGAEHQREAAGAAVAVVSVNGVARAGAQQLLGAGQGIAQVHRGAAEVGQAGDFKACRCRPAARAGSSGTTTSAGAERGRPLMASGLGAGQRGQVQAAGVGQLGGILAGIEAGGGAGFEVQEGFVGLAGAGQLQVQLRPGSAAPRPKAGWGPKVVTRLALVRFTAPGVPGAAHAGEVARAGINQRADEAGLPTPGRKVR